VDVINEGDPSPKMAEIRDAYRAHVARMLMRTW
jgi:hypothetical protein